MMKLTFISDTHSKHQNLKLAGGDFLFHCGDFTKKGDVGEVLDFAKFIGGQDYKYKIVIAGNHDFCFENENREAAEKILKDYGIIYLNDSGVVLDDIKIWGSPVQPWFYNWAFNRQRGSEIKKHWDQIPADVNILLTHGPPYGILDKTYSGESVGCEELLKAVTRIRPHVHAFGHIHEAYGEQMLGTTTLINACSCDLSYKIKHRPVNLSL